MQLTDDEWAQVLDVAYNTALRITRDPSVSDDIAASTVARLLERNPDIQPGRLNAYAAQVARNLVNDEFRAAKRQPRQDELEEDPIKPAPAYLLLALQQTGPSTAALRSERARRCYAVAMEILPTLTDQERRLLQMTADGATSAEIAAELGYADANSVNVTRHRLNKRIRQQFAQRISPSLFA